MLNNITNIFKKVLPKHTNGGIIYVLFYSGAVGFFQTWKMMIVQNAIM